MNRIKTKKRMTMALGVLLLVGSASCMPLTSHMKPQSALDMEPMPAAHTPPAEEGSLWTRGRAANLYSDLKACQVNDIVTISIVESASASKNATTNTERESDLSAGWSGILETFQARGMIKELGNSHSVKFGNNFDGKGETTRTSTMTAFITARVIRVLPNGNMVIRGVREVRVNNENQYIYIQGVIRPEDVSSQNIILSTYISDAVIELSGYGVVSDKQHPGWLARAFDWVWPF